MPYNIECKNIKEIIYKVLGDKTMSIGDLAEEIQLEYFKNECCEYVQNLILTSCIDDELSNENKIRVYNKQKIIAKNIVRNILMIERRLQ